MSAVILRDTTENDIEPVRMLYSGKISGDELRWALLYPLRDRTSRSFVAIAEDKIIGHVGFAASEYGYGRSTFMGVHPIFWIVDPDYRGKGVGVQLMKKALGYGDFSFIIGGEPRTRTLYPRFNLNFRFHIKEYCKLLDPRRYMRTMSDSFSKKMLKTIFLAAGALKNRRPAICAGDIKLDAYDREIGVQGRRHGSIVHNTENRGCVNWLLDCPSIIEAHAFTIKCRDDPIGIVICYIDRKNNVFTGRIVHISYLGDNADVWASVLNKVEDFFRKKGCAVISTLASHPDHVAALGSVGYVSTNRKGRPFFLADTNNAFRSASDTDWHLTFAEGDMGYRGV